MRGMSREETDAEDEDTKQMRKVYGCGEGGYTGG